MDLIVVIYSIMFFFGIYFLLFFVISYYKNRSNLDYFPEAKKLPSISFLIPAYNEEKTIGGTLQSLINVDYPKSLKEIIVIDDGSKDNTKQIVELFVKKHKEVRLLSKPNSGKANSLNLAIKIAKGELIAVVDADSHPSESSVKMMVWHFQDKNVVAVTSKVWIKNKDNFIEKFQDVDYVVIAWTRKLLDFVGCVYVTNGPLSIYRKNIVKEVGGFDPKNVTEDIELTWNLLSRGYETRMSYSAKVYTVVPNTLNKWIKQRVRWNIGGLQTLAKYRKFFFRGKNLFGYFVISYVSLSFILSLLGLGLFLRFLYYRISPYITSIPYFFKGYNPFIFIDFNFSMTILLVLGLIFLILSLFYHKLALRNSEVYSNKISTILIYTFVYRPLYMIPLVWSLFKLIIRDVRWFTK